MSKLHELLAVEGDLDGVAKKVMEEAFVTFTKKVEHFIGAHKWLEMFDEDRKQEEEAFVEHKELVTTVPEKLVYISEAIIKYYDAIAQKEYTNQMARADVELDGEAILKGMPATLLLGLESRLKFLRGIYDGIPTLAPGIEWVPDKTRSEYTWKAKELDTRHKTEKAFKYQILVQPTKEHPAQIEKWNVDTPVGNFKTEKWCGALSPASKSKLLGRVDNLIRAIKKARQRANTQEVLNVHIGETIFNYLHGDF